MTNKLKASLGIIVIIFATFLSKSCAKKSTSITNCESKADEIKSVIFEPSLGNVSLNTELYYTSVTRNECEIGLADDVSRDKFEKISLALIPLLQAQNSSGEKTMAFTIYRAGELHKDSSIQLNDIVGVSRYYTQNNKLYHQLFTKNMQDNKFAELTDLKAEIDGVIFNYMHAIGKLVLGMRSPSTAFFFKIQDAENLYSNLKNAHDDLRWKLKIYLQKIKMQKSGAFNGMRTESALDGGDEFFETCGTPCTKSDGSVCRNGDREAEPGAKCGPKVTGTICPRTQMYDLVLADTAIDAENVHLDNGITTTLESCLDADILTKFRDSVLYRSAAGVKYVDYYYLLGDRLNGLIDLSAALQTLTAAFDVSKAVNSLMNSSANANSILITSTFKTELVNVLNLYRNKSSDPDALHAIDDIISDMNFLQGKTIGEVRTLLSM